ncbi:hypothetical protein [Microcoleus sp. FACHB-672]|uniref:hypothetical protein n=1 Tax=Microcoleus sp. FACHB-672 TaxID=2692825 RepID=UPI0016857303|nr:hypothetical protein [Microcoleus sp. FACHB-672]
MCCPLPSRNRLLRLAVAGTLVESSRINSLDWQVQYFLQSVLLWDFQAWIIGKRV